MYNVSNLYKDVIAQPERLFKMSIRIEHENGTLYLEDKHLALGSFNVVDASQSGDEFTVGGAVAKHVEFTLVNSKEYEDIKFMGAKVIPTVSLMVREAIDAHFMQPSQPSKMPGYDDLWEYIPLGQFNIDVVDRLRNTIEIKAMDNMILLDKPYSLSSLKYPSSLANILNDICSIAGVGTPNMDFPNSDYVVKNRPKEDLTLRNVVGYIAELAGSFAKFDRTGRLHMRWYEPVDKVVTKHQRSEFELGDFSAQITGVVSEGEKVDDEDVPVYVVGDDEYAIDLSGNILLQGDYATVLPKILSNVGGVKFTPYTAKWNGDPAIDVGDIVTHVDLDGVSHNAVVTNTSYKYMGISEMSGKASPNITRGFKSSDNRLAAIIGRVEDELGSELSNLQQEQLRATELIGNMLGGHVSHITDKDGLVYQEFGSGIFIHDAPELPDSTKIWKWGIGGFGFSDDGGKTYMTGVTIDGSIVANIISANHINTGTLTGNKGDAWFNLDTEEFKFGGLQLIDNEFSLTLSDIDLDGNMLSDTITSINSNIDGVETTVKKYADDGIISAESRINQTISSIESSVKSYTDDLVSSSESNILQTVDSISSTVSTINANYATTSQITQLSGQITSKVSKDDFTGYKVASMITQSSTAIDLIASNITLSADNIDLDGITRVNADLRIGSTAQPGKITLANGAIITGYGSTTPYAMLSAGNTEINGSRSVIISGGKLDLTGVSEVTGNNIVKPYYPGARNACYIDYDSSGGRLAIRNSGGSHVGYVKLT